jgi:hypothetical protein
VPRGQLDEPTTPAATRVKPLDKNPTIQASRAEQQGRFTIRHPPETLPHRKAGVLVLRPGRREPDAALLSFGAENMPLLPEPFQRGEHRGVCDGLAGHQRQDLARCQSLGAAHRTWST